MKEDVIKALEEVRPHLRQIVNELFRRLILPVEVCYGADKGLSLTLPDKKVTDGLERPLPPLLRTKLDVFVILDLERQDFVQSR